MHRIKAFGCGAWGHYGSCTQTTDNSSRLGM